MEQKIDYIVTSTSWIDTEEKAKESIPPCANKGEVIKITDGTHIYIIIKK